MSEWIDNEVAFFAAKDAEIASLQQQLSDCKSSLRAVEADRDKWKQRWQEKADAFEVQEQTIAVLHHQKEAADAREKQVRAALERIAALNPDKDSKEGWNEWGEADCFDQAQAIARRALDGQTEPGEPQ